MALSERLKAAGITVDHQFKPGDLGWLIHIHGVQNLKDYGFNEVHEAYCARIATDFMLNPQPRRQRVWLTRKDGVINGSDYTLMDNAFNSQGAQITASIAAKPAAKIVRFSNVAVTAPNISAADSNDWFTDERKKPKASFFE